MSDDSLADGENSEIEDEANPVIRRELDPSKMLAIAHYSDGGTEKAHQYFPGENGFVLASWKDGCGCSQKPKTQRQKGKQNETKKT